MISHCTKSHGDLNRRFMVKSAPLMYLYLGLIQCSVEYFEVSNPVFI